MRQTDNPADAYREIVEYYDLEHDDYRDDLALIEHLVDTVGDPVLELACGTGRVLAALSREGRRLTGIDTSAPMLERARARLNSTGRDVSLVKADMSEFSCPGTDFGIIIVALNGLLHATTQEKQRGVLACAFRSLDPRGMLYVDVANPLAHWPAPGLLPVVLEGCWELEDGLEVQKFASISVNQASQTVSSRIWYDVGSPTGELHRHGTTFDLRYLHAPELELMLELAGFVEWHIYGSYELEPYTSESPRIIALAEKSASR